MADRTELEAAAAAGVIGAEQVQPLHDFLASRQAAPMRVAAPGEEDLRFIRNFHDVFLAIGILLFAGGLAVAIGAYAAGASDDPQHGALLIGGLSAAAAGVMWLLGEIFARRRRLFLPAIAIVCAMTLFAMFAALMIYGGLLIGRGFDANLSDFRSVPPEIRIGIFIALAFAVLAPLAFYLRFRLPFSLGLTGGGAALFVIVGGLISNFDLTMQLLPSLCLALGIMLFLAGVAFDARDPTRSSRLSDNGFWLHMAAAPLILRGALGLVEQAFGAGVSTGDSSAMVLQAGQAGSASVAAQAGMTLAVVAVLAFVSLLINRRALIVSALITTGVAIGILLNATGLGAGALAASTLITLGAFVLILGAGWHVARRALLGWIKPNGLMARIIPPESAAAA